MKNKAFKIGSISLVFLIIGFQTALLFSKASVLYIEAKRDSPDTVFVYLKDTSTRTAPTETKEIVKKQSTHSPAVSEIREKTKKVESFRFNPNTVSLEDLQRLGFSPKQAQSIINYRSKGGRFRRPDDFAKSYVVSDSVFQRLKPYIDIPKININTADSLTLIQLPGIGGYFAKQIIEYRNKLGGYSNPEQLLDIHNFDTDKYEGLKDLITCSPIPPSH